LIDYHNVHLIIIHEQNAAVFMTLG
jgi:hypothetical protein